MKPIEDDANIGRGNPILKNRRVIKVGSRRPALQGAERDPADGRETVTTGISMTVGASGLLLVRLCDGGAIRSAVYSPTLRRIELERLPRLPVVHRFVNRDRVRLGRFWTELQANVGQFVFLS